MPTSFKNIVRSGALIGTFVLALAAPSAQAVTQIKLNDDAGTLIPCYGMTIVQSIADPCPKLVPPYYSTAKLMDAWETAAIIGWTGPVASTGDDSKTRIIALEQQNSTLQSQVQALTQKVNQLASAQGQQPVAVAPIIQSSAPTVSGDFGSRLAAVEKRIKELDMITSMAEVNIGSLYARMDQLLAPIKKVLKLK